MVRVSRGIGIVHSCCTITLHALADSEFLCNRIRTCRLQVVGIVTFKNIYSSRPITVQPLHHSSTQHPRQREQASSSTEDINFGTPPYSGTSGIDSFTDPPLEFWISTYTYSKPARADNLHMCWHYARQKYRVVVSKVCNYELEYCYSVQSCPWRGAGNPDDVDADKNLQRPSS